MAALYWTTNNYNCFWGKNKGKQNNGKAWAYTVLNKSKENVIYEK
jgi:hypothetical protein